MIRAEQIWNISIHALREEGDFLRQTGSSGKTDFYPRPPRGGRQFLGGVCSDSQNFYPRPPRGGRRQTARGRLVSVVISIHALREEGDKGLL